MHKIKVLIVDDDPMVADINQRFTEAIEGFSVTGVAHNGKEALEMLETYKPDLIILDIYMPNTDGLEVLAQLRRQEKPVDIILITAANDSEIIEKVMRYGVVDYIIKPFKFERYKNTLEAYRDYSEKIEHSNTFNQAELDRFFSARMAKTGKDLPKNLHEQTLESILKLLGQMQEPQSAEELAAQLGISRVTARRYLEYLVMQGKVQMLLEYLRVGRPIHRFKIKA